MNAVASTRTKNDSPTRQNASAPTSPSADYADVPVLLRLPNLDRPIAAPTLEQPFEAGEVEDVSTSTRTNSRSERRTDRGDASTGTQRTTSKNAAINNKPASSTPKALALLWRAGIVVAAIGLVVLAYRIINGPPTTGDGLPGDRYNSVAAGDALPTSPETSTDQVTPAPLTFADTASPTIVTPELATPLTDDHGHTEDAHANAEVPSLEGINPSRASEQPYPNPTEYSTNEATTPEWDSAPTAEISGVQARPWNESTVGGDEFAQPSSAYDQQRSWANDNQSQPNYADTASPDSYRGYNTASTPTYRETDPRTWRTPEQWDQAARFGQPTNQRDPAYDTWQENSRSASRLRGEIEQPPLRR